MSESLIDHWLDGEIDEGGMSQLEEWLREDSAHLQDFHDAVQLQEDLILHYGKTRAPAVSPPPRHRRIRLVAALTALATILVVSFLLIPRTPDLDPRPTADPLLWVLAGNPQVELARIDPGPNPFFIPVEEWAVETRITFADGRSSLRWGDDCTLDGGPGTVLALSLADPSAPDERRSIRVTSGSLAVRLDAPVATVDVLIGDARVRAAEPTAFTLDSAGPQPSGRSPELAVVTGSVEILRPDNTKRKVAAGERVSIP
ncbi:MAG: hypothetical protein QGG36_01705 [Pirellulaceae bacterium]|jgi:hypothetical protein|nr:hypothetical protein [Pirellulaceae bacterium]MDP7014493.1 hypothetical protein [Pirellulaceae bacterium]